MSNHTPGPWDVTTTPAGKGKVIDSRGFSVCSIASGSYKQQMIDARLIAAAPEMLDMLKKCLEALEYVGPWETPVGLIERVQGLIDKAEGNDAAK